MPSRPAHQVLLTGFFSAAHSHHVGICLSGSLFVCSLIPDCLDNRTTGNSPGFFGELSHFQVLASSTGSIRATLPSKPSFSSSDSDPDLGAWAICTHHETHLLLY